MTSKNTEYSIVFVMDASGSMESMGNEPVESLNAFYDEQKKNCKFKTTLIFFNNILTCIYDNIDSDNILKIDKTVYKTGGMTALYDAIGFGIDKQIEEKTENVIFVILTDGIENASTKFTSREIKKRTDEMKSKYDWKFIYLGANQDAIEVGKTIGANYSSDYDYTPLGFRDAMRSISRDVTEHISVDIENNETKIDLGEAKLEHSNKESEDNFVIQRC